MTFTDITVDKVNTYWEKSKQEKLEYQMQKELVCNDRLFCKFSKF